MCVYIYIYIYIERERYVQYIMYLDLSVFSFLFNRYHVFCIITRACYTARSKVG